MTVEKRVRTEVARGPSVSLFSTVFTLCRLNHDIGLINNVLMMQNHQHPAHMMKPLSHGHAPCGM